MVKKNQNINTDLSDESKSFNERIDEIRSLVEENLRYTKTLKESSGGSNQVKSQKELQKLLKQNLEISKDLYEMTKKIKRWVTMQRVWSIVKILIILIPIVLGAIYLPPLISQWFEPVKDLYGNVLNLNQQAEQQQDLIQKVTDQFK